MHRIPLALLLGASLFANSAHAELNGGLSASTMSGHAPLAVTFSATGHYEVTGHEIQDGGEISLAFGDSIPAKTVVCNVTFEEARAAAAAHKPCVKEIKHTYATPGKYTVKLIHGPGFCAPPHCGSSTRAVLTITVTGPAQNVP